MLHSIPKNSFLASAEPSPKLLTIDSEVCSSVCMVSLYWFTTTFTTSSFASGGVIIFFVFFGFSDLSVFSVFFVLLGAASADFLIFLHCIPKDSFLASVQPPPKLLSLSSGQSSWIRTSFVDIIKDDLFCKFSFKFFSLLFIFSSDSNTSVLTEFISLLSAFSSERSADEKEFSGERP